MTEWSVFESTPIRDIIDQNTFPLPDGNQKKVGGDIHTTVDADPASETFGEAHWTMRIPGCDQADHG